MTHDSSGQSLIEYALLVATIAVLAIAAALLVGQAISKLFVDVSTAFR